MAKKKEKPPQRPRIGITTSLDGRRQQVSHNYVEAIEKAGGLPVIVPFMTSKETVEQFTGMLDGLLITGGPGIEDGIIGELPDNLKPVEELRYTSDKLFYNFMKMKNKPVFGVCYGMQLMNALAGGLIYGDLSKEVKNARKHVSEKGGFTAHEIYLEEGTQFHKLFKKKAMAVNSFHQQSIESVGEGFVVSARAPDGLIEAIESTDGLQIGVQFHPEIMGDRMDPLFQFFVELCRHPCL
jgi:putative glutamine amidotransferase